MSAHRSLLIHLRSVLMLTIDATCLYCVLPIFSPWVVPPKFLTRPVTAISIVCGSWRIRANALPVLGPRLYPALLCYNLHNKRANPLPSTQVSFTIRCIRYACAPRCHCLASWRQDSLDHGSAVWTLSRPRRSATTLWLVQYLYSDPDVVYRDKAAAALLAVHSRNISPDLFEIGDGTVTWARTRLGRGWEWRYRPTINPPPSNSTCTQEREVFCLSNPRTPLLLYRSRMVGLVSALPFLH